jgi:hypothetical protein
VRTVLDQPISFCYITYIFNTACLQLVLSHRAATMATLRLDLVALVGDLLPFVGAVD